MRHQESIRLKPWDFWAVSGERCSTSYQCSQAQKSFTPSITFLVTEVIVTTVRALETMSKKTGLIIHHIRGLHMGKLLYSTAYYIVYKAIA